VAALQQIARCLERTGGKLIIYGPLEPQIASTVGLVASNIEIAGLVSAERLKELLRERADVLFVPMSFEAEHRHNMEISFPSKLADYTAVGLPILIYGPQYCSAVRWAVENAGVAEVVTEEDELALLAVVSKMASDQSRRIELARNALVIGDICFSHASAFRLFRSVVTRGRGA
jgi:glycosyltransferase involved in cell wall biosynthesis